MIDFRNNYINEKIKDIVIKHDDSKLEIVFAGNLDLYLNASGKKERIKDEHFNKKISFNIEQEDEEWEFFNRLYESIINSDDYEKSRLVQNEIISWYSDEAPLEEANLLTISKMDERIDLSFYRNISSYSLGFPIRICNSGSRYGHLSVPFMKMFHEFQELSKKSIKTLKNTIKESNN